jgi:hypothetical protein
MKSLNNLALVSTLVAVGCGTPSKKKEDAALPVPQTEELVPETQKNQTATVALPATALVRVPVGTDGKEDLTKAELRLQDQPATISGAEIMTAFEKAAIYETLAKEDELDKSSSTQSWYFGRYGSGNYNSYNFNSCYQPTYYSNGASYAYDSYPQTYGYGGYNYYSYSRPQTYANYDYSSYGSNSSYNNGGYNSGGYNSGGYDNGGYNNGGYNNGGYNSGGYDNGGYNNGGYNNGGYNNGGYNSGGYDNGGYNNGGYNSGGSYNAGGSNSTPNNSGY